MALVRTCIAKNADFTSCNTLKLVIFQLISSARRLTIEEVLHCHIKTKPASDLLN